MRYIKRALTLNTQNLDDSNRDGKHIALHSVSARSPLHAMNQTGLLIFCTSAHNEKLRLKLQCDWQACVQFKRISAPASSDVATMVQSTLYLISMTFYCKQLFFYFWYKFFTWLKNHNLCHNKTTVLTEYPWRASRYGTSNFSTIPLIWTWRAFLSVRERRFFCKTFQFHVARPQAWWVNSAEIYQQENVCHLSSTQEGHKAPTAPLPGISHVATQVSYSLTDFSSKPWAYQQGPFNIAPSCRS